MSQLVSESQRLVRPEGGSFSLRSIVTVLFRRRLVILAIALPLIAIGGINLFGQAGSFTASAQVVVDLARVDLPKWNVNGRNVDYNRDLNTLVNSAMTMTVAQAAAFALQDSIPIMKGQDKNLYLLDEPNALAEFLLEGFDVSVLGESAILDFRFTSSSARISLMAVEAMRSAFLNFQVDVQKNDRAVEYYSEQRASVRADMDSLLAERGAVMVEAGFSSMIDEMRYRGGLLANTQTELLKAEVGRRALESEHKKLMSYLDGDPRDFPMGMDENRSSTLVYWMNTLAGHDDELNRILSLYTVDSAVATRQKNLIDESVKNLAAEERKYVRSLELSLISAKERESTLRRQVVTVQEKNSEANEVYRKVSLLDSELKALKKLLESLQAKIGEVSLAQFADDRVSSTSVLSNPSIISVLTGGTTIIYFVALIFIALALGVICGFVIENLDHRLYSPVDVEENLKLPVFASVSRVD